MDKRTKKRVKEHSQDGHKLEKRGTAVSSNDISNDHTLFECACGWLGWLVTEDMI